MQENRDEKENQEYKVLEWNINLRSNKKATIPKFVSEKIIKQKADIVILTEFVHCKNSDDFLRETFQENGYDYVTSENSKVPDKIANDIVIAWNNKKFNKSNGGNVNCFKCDINNPNFLYVSLEKSGEGKEKLNIAGIRITLTEYDKKNKYPYLNKNDFYKKQAGLRYNEMKMIYHTLDSLISSYDNVLIAGDFNNYKSDTLLTEWNINRLACERKDYCVYTPQGSSWDGDCKNEYALDHFITKNCSMENNSIQYNRNFTNCNKKIYYKDCKFNLKGINPPYPDHAMLIGTLIL